MEYLFIYLLQMTDLLCDLQIFIYITLFVGIFAYIIFYIFIKCDYYDCEEVVRRKRFIRSAKKFITTCIICIVCLGIIPTKQTLLLVGGTYLGKKVITSEKMQKIDKIIELQLDKYIDELENKN